LVKKSIPSSIKFCGRESICELSSLFALSEKISEKFLLGLRKYFSAE
jgi:hypothetical protein